MLTDTAIINAFLDTAGDMRAMREQLSLSAAEVLEALQRPAVQEYTEALAIELARTREVREALVLTKLASELRPSLEAATDPSLRCRIVNTLIRTAKTSAPRTQREKAQRAAQHITHPKAEPATQPAAQPIAQPAAHPAPLRTANRQPPHTTEPAQPAATNPKSLAPTRPPFLNRAARRAAKQTANQPAPLQPISTRHAA